MARSLTKPPTEAEVAAEWHDRVQRTARHEQPQHARDLEWAGVVERQQELARTVPTSSVAWQICKGYWLGAAPLDPTTLQPIGEPLLDPVTTVDYWTQHCDAAVGVRLGPVRGGTMALVGVKATSWAGWRAWVREHAVTERVVPWSDEDSRGELIRDLRPLGGPLAVKWQDRPGSPMRATAVTRGDRQMREAAERLRLMNQGKDRGGWLAWSAGPDEKGRLPVLSRHELAAGLEVMASTDALPLWARRADDGSVLKQDGRIREPDANNDLPAWLAEVFGAKWERVR